ncbi:MAG TPA: DUF5652 family protein [Candidatus Paceibacterota bacterium]
MKNKIIRSSLFTFFFLGVFLFPENASASCIQLSLEEQKAMAQVIVQGETLGITGRIAEVKVEKYYKGEGPATVRVNGYQTSDAITSVDFPLEKGKRYLLFLQGDSMQIFQTNACAGNREIANGITQEEMAVLGQGYSPHIDIRGSNELQNITDIFLRLLLNPFLLIALALWTLSWKGVALWKASRRGEKKWFIAILVLNTLAILEIIYIFFFAKKKGETPHEG